MKRKKVCAKIELKSRGGGHKGLKAFTLAEVLITIVIIGIVAALTIPTVLKDYNDKKYNTARLKALKTFGEAGKMASINDEMNSQANATDFVNKVLSKYLKIVKVCDNALDCGFPKTIIQPHNLSYLMNWTSDNMKTWRNISGVIGTANEWTDLSNPELSTYVATADGFSAKIFYNPKCVRNTKENPFFGDGYSCGSSKECATYALDDTCMNVIYDMNGSKKPNIVGQDVGFVTVFWSGLNSTAAAPGMAPYEKNNEIYSRGTTTNQTASEWCSSLNSGKSKYSLPSIDELSSLVVNQNISGTPGGQHLWSGSGVYGSSNKNWFIRTQSGLIKPAGYNYFNVWCVRR